MCIRDRVKTKKKLSRADKKQIEAAIARANRTDKKGKSALTFPYFERVPDQSVIAGTNGNRYDRAISTRGKD